MVILARIDDRERLFYKLQELGVRVLDDGTHDFSLEFENGDAFYIGVDPNDDTLYIELDGDKG